MENYDAKLVRMKARQRSGVASFEYSSIKHRDSLKLTKVVISEKPKFRILSEKFESQSVTSSSGTVSVFSDNFSSDLQDSGREIPENDDFRPKLLQKALSEITLLTND